MSLLARQEKIRKEIEAIYREPSKALETSRRRFASCQMAAFWLSLFTTVVLILGFRGWPIAILAFTIGLTIGIGMWMKMSFDRLPDFLKYTTLRPELFPEPNQSPEPTAPSGRGSS